MGNLGKPFSLLGRSPQWWLSNHSVLDSPLSPTSRDSDSLCLGVGVGGIRQLGLYNKVPQTGWFTQEMFIVSQCWRLEHWRLENKVSAKLVSSEASCLGLLMVFFSLCLHMVSPLCLSVSFPSSKDTVMLD